MPPSIWPRRIDCYLDYLPFFTFFQKLELPRQPLCSRRLYQDCHENGDEGDRCNHLRAGRFHTEQQTGKRGRNDARLPRPAHEYHLVEPPPPTTIRQCTQENRRRAGDQHEDGDHNNAADEIMAHEREIDLSTEQYENEQAHDERRCRHIFFEFLCLARSHFYPERALVSEHDAKDENRSEPARLQPIGREIGADDGHDRHYRRIFFKECPPFVRDEQRGQVSEGSAGDDAHDQLLEQIEQR